MIPVREWCCIVDQWMVLTNTQFGAIHSCCGDLPVCLPIAPGLQHPQAAFGSSGAYPPGGSSTESTRITMNTASHKTWADNWILVALPWITLHWLK